MTEWLGLCISPSGLPAFGLRRAKFMKYRAVKGMNDILPEEARRFQLVEGAFRAAVEKAGYRELRTPIVEELALFHKSTGETSEVVQKQMFVLDRGREKLALISTLL